MQRPTPQLQVPHRLTTCKPTAFREVLSSLSGAWRGMRARRELNRIARLDDRLLVDIGITRGDVNAALSARWHEDSVDRLCELRDERRRARRNPRW